MLIDPQNFHLRVFHLGRNFTQEEKFYFNVAYGTWQKVWSEVFNQEMSLNMKLYSNDFSRQTRIVSLFHGNNCVGIGFMREIDFSLDVTREDSYFGYWPGEVLNNIHEEIEKVIIASNFTIAHEYRRSKHFEWKALFFSLYMDYYNTLPTPLMITAARKLRSNEKLCYDVGGVCMMKDVPYRSGAVEMRNEMTDLLYWRQNTNFCLLNRQLQDLREKIWSNFLKENHHEKLRAAC